MTTPFKQENQDFSNAAHVHAQHVVYPRLFGVGIEDLRFRDETLDGGRTLRSEILDGEFAVDKTILRRSNPGCPPYPDTVQERFRLPEYAKFRDLSVTVWNNETDRASEFYKIRAMWFVYGFFDPARTCFTELVVCPVPGLMQAMRRRLVPIGGNTNPRSSQPFATAKFDDLMRRGLIDLHIKNDEVVYDRFGDDPFTDPKSGGEDGSEPEAAGWVMPEMITTPNATHAGNPARQRGCQVKSKASRVGGIPP